MSQSNVWSLPGEGALRPRVRPLATRKLGSFNVSLEMIKDIFGFPDDANVINAWFNSSTSSVGFLVSSPNMPETLEGATAPMVTIEDIQGWDK